MLWITRFILIAVAGLLAAPSDLLAELSPQAQTRVENAIAFLSNTGDPDDLDAAARLRSLLDDGNIVVGEISDADDAASAAWTANGVISISPRLIGSPQTYNEIDWRPTPVNRGDWVYAFTIAQTLVHELEHISQGQDYVNSSKGYLSNSIIGNADVAELEGWREGLSSATRWLKMLETRLKRLPPSVRAEFAYRLGVAASEVRASVEGTHQYFGRGGDFSDLQWRSPDGGVFRTEADAMQYLVAFEARMNKVQADVLAERAARPPAPAAAAQPNCCLGDGDGPAFCCQWLHPVSKGTTCSPARNRPLCDSLEQGRVVFNADCMGVGPDAGTCKAR